MYGCHAYTVSPNPAIFVQISRNQTFQGNFSSDLENYFICTFATSALLGLVFVRESGLFHFCKAFLWFFFFKVC